MRTFLFTLIGALLGPLIFVGMPIGVVWLVEKGPEWVIPILFVLFLSGMGARVGYAMATGK